MLPPLPDPAHTALFLDFDGTLVEIAPTPTTIWVEPALVGLLAGLLTRLGGALALVSGRPIAELDHFLSPLRLPAVGVHGCEVRTGDDITLTPAAPSLAAARDRLAAFVELNPGLLLEDKRVSLTLHYRQRADLAEAAQRIAREAAADSDGGLILLQAKMAVELKPAGIDKGIGIANMCALEPFKGRMPVFLGDDVTDEAGFGAVSRAGGMAIRIGGAREGSLAPYTLPDVSSVHGWLRDLATRDGI